MSESKISTIISHEYFSKLKTKGFLIGTLLAPLAMVLFFAVIIYISMMTGETSKKLAIIDFSNEIGLELVNSDTTLYYLTDKALEELKQALQEETIDGYVIIPKEIIQKGEVEVFTSGGGGVGFVSNLKSNLKDILRLKRLQLAGTDEEQIKLIESGVTLKTNKINKDGTEEKDDTEAMAFLGYILGFVIYFLVFIYGGFVSRAVIEEKSNRIVEILASSVKPFELMMGKVIGIGLLGLSQVLFWLLIGAGLLFVAGMIISPDAESLQNINNMAEMQKGMNSNDIELMIKEFSLPGITIWTILGFLFYFLGGYFVYATLFAGVGAAVDSEQDAAQLQLPISIPIIFSIITVPIVMSNPDGILAKVLSIFPLTSPVIMTVRIAATNVAIWEIALSVITLVITFYGAIWIAGKIYKIGILMTGKKPKIIDLIKWIKA